jgi:diguanylate cyclase (GGDEF)-like protein
VEPPGRALRPSGSGQGTVLQRADARLMRRGLVVASVIAAVLALGSAVVHLALGTPVATTGLAVAVATVFLGLRFVATRVPDGWLSALAGAFGLLGLVAILGAVMTETAGLSDYVVALVGMLPMALILFVPWSTREHLIWLGAGGVLLIAALVAIGSNTAIDRERVGLLAGYTLGGIISLVGQVMLRTSRQRVVEQTQAAHDRRSALLESRRELRAANRRAETTLRQLQGMEGIGRALAEQGPTPEALAGVVGLLVETFGYTYPSIYTSDGRLLRLGAQRGYEHPILEFEPSVGVIGRVARTREPVFLRDVTVDPDYLSADPSIRSEISIPLLAHGAFLGVLNVESAEELTDTDLAAISVVADRVAVALALAIERANLAERAQVFRRIVAFSAKVSSVLAASELYEVIVDAMNDVIDAQLVSITVRDPATGTYIIRADRGGGGVAGVVIEPGEGMAGRAIKTGELVRAEHFGRAQFPSTIRVGPATNDFGWALGVPLLGESGTIGALTVARIDHDRPFTDLELEALDLLAGEIALAVSNALLHGEVAELAIRDPLTGLHNRRFLDEAFKTLTAARARLPEDARHPLSIILFDLDHFGAYNKLHGHLAGDDVLRTFGRLLLGRLREADLVGRYGGEEFVAILQGASRADACRVAEEIRAAIEASPMIDERGATFPVTVSAGCAEADAGETTPESLIRSADVALSMAKRAGRNRIVAI